MRWASVGVEAGRYAFNRTADFRTVQDIKEELCYVSFDYERDLKLAQETTHLVKSYTLPDGRVIQVGAERFMVRAGLLDHFTPARSPPC